MAGIYLADGVSGSHVNPMMSLTLAVYRGFPWHEFSVYLVAQSLVHSQPAVLRGQFIAMPFFRLTRD